MAPKYRIKHVGKRLIKIRSHKSQYHKAVKADNKESK